MGNLDDPLDTWQPLVEAINSQPGPARQAAWLGLRAFVHDLRQSLGQVKAAEGILRRLLAESPPGPELAEMLDIIRSAAERASGSLAELSTGLIEPIDHEAQ